MTDWITNGESGLNVRTKLNTIPNNGTAASFGTAAALNVGVLANNIVQLDGSARLPAVNGSQLTGLPSAAGTGIYNVKDYGAVGNGIADDTVAINACLAAAWAGGVASGGITTGGIVLFPAGAYKVTSTISAALATGSITIVGSGMYNTSLIGNINGFVLDKPDNTGTVIQSIRDLSIVNQSTTLGTGALRFGFVSSANLENLLLQGIIGLDAGADQFQSRYANIIASANFENQIPGSIGMVCCDATFVGCNVLGYDTGYLVGGTTSGSNAGAPGTNFIGCRAEVCAKGWDLGKNILGNNSGAGVMMVGCQSERCYETIVVSNVAPFSILGGSFTGTVGPAHYFHIDIGGSLTWSGGTATLVIPATMPSLDSYGWTSGNREVVIEAATPTGYNTWPSHVTATRTGVRTFTFPLVSNPGGANTNTWADWSFRCQSGIKLLGAQSGLISGVSLGFSDLEVAGLDFSALDGGLLTVQGTYSSISLPPAQRKAGVIFDNCGISPAMAYADLPGQPGVWLNAVIGGAKEGMEYSITDCNTATWGATAAAGGSNHVLVRYNGTNWTVVGK